MGGPEAAATSDWVSATAGEAVAAAAAAAGAAAAAAARHHHHHHYQAGSAAAPSHLAYTSALFGDDLPAPAAGHRASWEEGGRPPVAPRRGGSKGDLAG